MSKKLLVTNTFFQLGAKAASSASTFLLTILLANAFGAEGYGVFTKVTTFVAFFYLLADFGFNAFYIQEDKQERYFATLLLWRIAAAVLLIVLANAIAFSLPFNPLLETGFSETAKLGIFVFSITILSYAITMSAAALFQKRSAYHRLFWATAIGSGVMTALVILGILQQVSLIAIIALYATGMGITALLSLFFVRRTLVFSFNPAFFKRMLLPTLPLGGMLLCNLLYFRADMLLLTFLRPTVDVGIYGLAYRFFDFLLTIPLFMANSVYPLLLQNQKNYRIDPQIVRSYGFLFVVVSLLVVSFGWILAPVFTLIKPEFISAILPYRILLLSLPIFFLTGFLQWVLIAQRQQVFLLWVYVLSAMLNIGLNFFFIPSYSYIASAIITGVSEAVALLLLVIQVRRLQKTYA